MAVEKTFLETRIESSKAKIEKFNKNILRLEGLIEKKKAKIASGKEEQNKYPNGEYWLTGDIKYHLEDIERARKEISYETKKLAEYQEKHNTEIERDNAIPEIETINKFLEEWKQYAFKYFVNLREEYKKVRTKKYKINKENLELLTKLNRKTKEYERIYTDIQITEILETIAISTNKYTVESLTNEVYYKIKNHYIERWINMHYNSDLIIIEKCTTDKELDKFLDKEVKSKKIHLINQVTEEGGKIIDASRLAIGYTGGLEGYIKCENGIVKVDTIIAEGEVQCRHFRCLVHLFESK